MGDSATMLLSLSAGAALGLLYFGGLWLTLQRLPTADRPKALLLGSFVGRTALVLGIFYILARVVEVGWEGLAVSLIGFLAIRFLLVRRWGLSGDLATNKT